MNVFQILSWRIAVSLIRAAVTSWLCAIVLAPSFAQELKWKKATNLEHWCQRFELLVSSFNGEMYLYWVDRDAAYGTNGGDVWSSTDGQRWFDRSADGVNWLPRMGFWQDAPVLHRGKLWVVNNDVRCSTDGLRWAVVTSQQPLASSFAAFDDRLWLVGLGGAWSSVDGEVWMKTSERFLDQDKESLHGTLLGFREALWHFNEETRLVRSSADGTNWQIIGTMPGAELWGRSIIAFADRIWLLGGAPSYYEPTSDVWASENGIHWTRMPTPPWRPRASFGATVHQGKLWVMGGRGQDAQPLNDVWCTSDGVQWEKVKDPPMWTRRENHAAVIFDGKMWVLGGWASNYAATSGDARRTFMADVWNSENGLDWNEVTSQAPWAARSRHACVAFRDRIWVLGGSRPGIGLPAVDTFLDDIWNSADGRQWNRVVEHAPWMQRGGHAALVFQDRMWILGGRRYNTDPGPGPTYRWYNDVWSSTDGVHWMVETASAPWAPRAHHAATVFKDKLWVLGGSIAPLVNISDVWCSENGRDWERVLGRAPWDYGEFPRDSHSALAHDDKLWVVGGQYWFAFADAWCSPDGLSWTRVTNLAPFGERSAHVTLAFANRLWLLGGYQTMTPEFFPGAQNDVWFSYSGTVADFTPVPTSTPTPTPTPTGTPTPTPTPGPESVMLFVLDDYGAVHTGGAANDVVLTGGPYFGWNIARALALVRGVPTLNASQLGAYVLDGYGAIHSYSAARPPQNFYFMPAPGDVAADLAVFQKDLAGVPGNVGCFVLDRTGRLWACGIADAGTAWTGSVQPPLDGVSQYAVALRLADTKGKSGWILDNMGNVHSFGGAADPAFPVSTQDNWVALVRVGEQLARMDASGILEWSGTPPEGWDLPMIDGEMMIDVEAQAGYGLIALDRFGALHATRGAILPPGGSGPPYFGFEAARDLELGPPFAK